MFSTPDFDAGSALNFMRRLWRGVQIMRAGSVVSKKSHLLRLHQSASLTSRVAVASDTAPMRVKAIG
jgi:hypothetical protein